MECNPKIAKACPYPYYWSAKFLADDEEVAQYTVNGEEVPYREVLNRLNAGKGLSFIEWRPTTKGLPIFRQEIDSTWQRPIVFRRHFKKMGFWTGEELEERILFALGWQATIGGKNVKSILYIDAETGQILISSKDW